MNFSFEKKDIISIRLGCSWRRARWIALLECQGNISNHCRWDFGKIDRRRSTSKPNWNHRSSQHQHHHRQHNRIEHSKVRKEPIFPYSCYSDLCKASCLRPDLKQNVYEFAHTTGNGSSGCEGGNVSTSRTSENDLESINDLDEERTQITAADETNRSQVNAAAVASDQNEKPPLPSNTIFQRLIQPVSIMSKFQQRYQKSS